MQLGRASLLLADPEAARRSFEQSVALRRLVAAKARRRTPARKSRRRDTSPRPATGWARRARAWVTTRRRRSRSARPSPSVRGWSASSPTTTTSRTTWRTYTRLWRCAPLSWLACRARRLYQKALQLVRAAFDKKPDKLEYRALLARTYHRLAIAALVEGDPKAAGQYFEEALPCASSLCKSILRMCSTRPISPIPWPTVVGRMTPFASPTPCANGSRTTPPCSFKSPVATRAVLPRRRELTALVTSRSR